MKRERKAPFWLRDYLHEEAWACGECGRVFVVRLRMGGEPVQCPFCSLDIRAAQNQEEAVRCST